MSQQEERFLNLVTDLAIEVDAGRLPWSDLADALTAAIPSLRWSARVG